MSCVNPSCEQKFHELECEQNDMKVTVKVMQNNIENLTKAVSSLTKAAWGVVISIAATGLGFIIWYIQNLKV